MSNGICKHCKKEDADTEHTLWDCPVVNKHRTNNKLSRVKHKKLPKAVLNGIPPAMSQDLTNTYWDKDVNNNHNIDNIDSDSSCIYMAQQPMHIKKAKSNNVTIQDTCSKHNVDQSNLNARQMFCKIKYIKGETIISLPATCTSVAPIKINVYTDGSWLHPLKQYLGIGGAGVWWPGRSIDKPADGGKWHPLNIAEQDIS